MAAWFAASIGLSVQPMSPALSLLCVSSDGVGRRRGRTEGAAVGATASPRLRGELGRSGPVLLTELHIMLILQASPCCTLRDSTGRPHGRRLPGTLASLSLFLIAATLTVLFQQLHDHRMKLVYILEHMKAEGPSV